MHLGSTGHSESVGQIVSHGLFNAYANAAFRAELCNFHMIAVFAVNHAQIRAKRIQHGAPVLVDGSTAKIADISDVPLPGIGCSGLELRNHGLGIGEAHQLRLGMIHKVAGYIVDVYMGKARNTYAIGFHMVYPSRSSVRISRFSSAER